MFAIEKGVPMPTEDRRGAKTKYPFAQMEKGDSILVGSQVSEKVRRAAWSHGRNHGMKFVTKKVANGLRIWRSE